MELTASNLIALAATSPGDIEELAEYLERVARLMQGDEPVTVTAEFEIEDRFEQIQSRLDSALDRHYERAEYVLKDPGLSPTVAICLEKTNEYASA